jgi:hypothetical protein
MAAVGAWITRPSLMSFEWVIHVELDGAAWRAREFGGYNPITPLVRDSGTRLSESDLVAVRPLTEKLYAAPRDTAILSATRALVSALTQRWNENRYALLWIALEALFGPADAREILFRISQRIALFLEADSEKARILFRRVREAYNLRSKIVHGLRLEKMKVEDARSLLEDVETWIRETLKRILPSPTLTDVFTGGKREEYLDELVFSRAAGPGGQDWPEGNPQGERASE